MGLESGDAILLEMFEGAPGTNLILSRTLTAASSLDDFYAWVSYGWQDLEGSVRLTMLSGSASISNFLVSAAKMTSPRGVTTYGTSLTFPPRPKLQFVPSPSALALRWPTSGASFVLESTLSLSPPLQWQLVTNPVQTVSNQFSVSVDYGFQSRFFRLVSQ